MKTTSGDTGPGLKVAGDAMQAMREWLGAEQLVASFTVEGHDVDVVVDELGVGIYHDGEEVPMVEAPETPGAPGGARR